MTDNVILFRDYERTAARAELAPGRSAIVIILPVVRVEHYDHFLDYDPPNRTRRPF